MHINRIEPSQYSVSLLSQFSLLGAEAERGNKDDTLAGGDGMTRMRELPAEDQCGACRRARDERRREGLLLTHGPRRPTALAEFASGAAWHDAAHGLLTAVSQRALRAERIRYELGPTIRHRPERRATLPW
jgi:hypothetical protein